MRRILPFLVVVSAGLALTGCEATPRPAPPQPEIRIERTESATDGVSLAVRYLYHTSDSASNCQARVVLDSPEKLQQYKKQVMFLLNQIEDAEKRMNVHEAAK